MSRKARKNLVGEVDDLTPGPEALAPRSASSRASRRIFLDAYTPRKMEAAVIAAVRPQMLESVLDVEYSTHASDKAMAHAYFLFANWCIQTRGAFDSAADLNIKQFDAFRAEHLQRYGPSSESTHMATLKRIERKGRTVKGRVRRQATPPLSASQWTGLLTAASESGDLATDAKTLLVLAGGLGLNAGEIGAARGTWVKRNGHKTSIAIVDKNLRTREVPVYGADADWLRARAASNPGGHIFWPEALNRTNSVCGFIKKMTVASSEFKGFKVIQARHMWLLNLLISPIPFHVVCAMAGINSDSNLASDLISFAPPIALNDIRAYVDPTKTHIEGTS